MRGLVNNGTTSPTSNASRKSSSPCQINRRLTSSLFIAVEPAGRSPTPGPRKLPGAVQGLVNYLRLPAQAGGAIPIAVPITPVYHTRAFGFGFRISDFGFRISNFGFKFAIRNSQFEISKLSSPARRRITEPHLSVCEKKDQLSNRQFDNFPYSSRAAHST